MFRAALIASALAACSSAAPAPADPPALAADPAPADAGVDAAPPDADVAPEVASAPPFVFRYRTAQRTETWTFRSAGTGALMIVESAQGTQRYIGTITDDGAAQRVAVTTGTARLALECKREQLAVSATCNDPKAKPIAVLNCYHADFKAPMPFAPAPGVEYVVDASCNGYRLLAP